MKESTRRIYEGHLRRYEAWCDYHDRLRSSERTFAAYVKKLSDERVSPLYLRDATNTIRRRWLRKGDAVVAGHDRGKRNQSRSDGLLRRFSVLQLRRLRDHCLANREHDELSLLVLLLMDTFLRPKQLLQRFGFPEVRRRMLVTRTRLVDPASPTEFLFDLPPARLFHRRHNTYLHRFKVLLGRLFVGSGVERNGSLEMLKRSVRAVGVEGKGGFGGSYGGAWETAVDSVPGTMRYRTLSAATNN